MTSTTGCRTATGGVVWVDNPLGGRGGGRIRNRSLLEVGAIPAGSQDKLQDPPEDSPSALEVAEDRRRVLYGWGRAGALTSPRRRWETNPRLGMGGVRVRVALNSGLLATEVQDSKLSLRSRTTSSSTRRASAMKHAHQRQGQGRL